LHVKTFFDFFLRCCSLAQRPLIYHANPFLVKSLFQVTLLLSAALSILAPSSALCQDTFFALFRRQCCLSYHPLRALSRLFSATFRRQRCLSYYPFWELSRLIFFTLFATAFSSLLPF